MQAGKENAEKYTACRHRKTETEIIQLYMVYIDYKRRRLYCQRVLSKQAIKA